jgi:hypothetical protein
MASGGPPGVVLWAGLAWNSWPHCAAAVDAPPLSARSVSTGAQIHLRRLRRLELTMRGCWHTRRRVGARRRLSGAWR